MTATTAAAAHSLTITSSTDAAMDTYLLLATLTPVATRNPTILKRKFAATIGSALAATATPAAGPNLMPNRKKSVAPAKSKGAKEDVRCGIGSIFTNVTSGKICGTEGSRSNASYSRRYHNNETTTKPRKKQQRRQRQL